MDKDIADMVDSCKGCALAAKASTITCKLWRKTVQLWQRIHVDFAGLFDNQYYLIVVDSYTKWLEVLKCKRTTTNCTIGFLHELFARFGVVDCVVTDNATQFTSNEFKQFCDTYQVKHITTLQYHLRSNGQAKWFVDTLKRALKKVQGTPTDRALQQFLQVYRITPNPNKHMGCSPAETMFARKIRSVFDKLIPRQARFTKTVTLPKKRYACGKKVLFKIYKNNMTFWEVGTVKQRVGELVYIIQGPKNIHKRHLNQLRKYWVNDLNVSTPQICEEPIDTIFENFDFDLDAPQASPVVRRSNRKRKFTDPLSVDPKRRKY